MAQLQKARVRVSIFQPDGAGGTEELRRSVLATGGFVERLTPATSVERVAARLAQGVGSVTVFRGLKPSGSTGMAPTQS